MKYYNKLLLGAISLGILTACADESLLQPGESVQKPEEMVQLEYLNQYDVLKNYVNRGENPNFKLGVAIAASDFLKKELVYGLAVSNFDEMTAGNAMKYASIVKDDGSVDFSQVTSFVQTAKEAGMTVYGHTLCWHSQQNKTYLEKLIAPTIIPGEGGDGGRCLVLKNASALANNYDAQTWYQFDAPLANGQKYTLKFMAKASSDFAPEIYLQSSPSLGGNQQYPGSVSTIGTTWQEITFYFTPSDALVDKVAFNFGSLAGEIYIDNITLTADGSDENLIANSDFENGTITGWTGWTPGKFEKISEDGEGYAWGQIEEMPNEEKKKVLTNALEDWIKGMMAACKENPNIEEGESAGATLVKAWDVVNEPMSDRYPSQLKSAATEGEENAAQSFYWQDYLGKEYAREVVKFARKYGGEDLKLFVNDYNLEAAYNNNAKCQGLIDMIAYWEADGVTIIDGIATQMHVSYSLNPEEQAKNEACVVKMFQLLAASGKLVKISELDMGILDESGTEIKTENVTLEQQKLMSDYYQFIISKYFEIIPQSQRYGITQWSPADSPVGSGWRAGLPIGLWNLNYDRKPTYAGFANGLAGKIIEPESTGK
ncbi:MAG: endo-1,4-beta-xylanase [Bacteroides sp.]|nr:endo-1,4-beta-xylanase [Bacteroides sp.]